MAVIFVLIFLSIDVTYYVGCDDASNNSAYDGYANCTHCHARHPPL